MYSKCIVSQFDSEGQDYPTVKGIGIPAILKILRLLVRSQSVGLPNSDDFYPKSDRVRNRSKTVRFRHDKCHIKKVTDVILTFVKNTV